MSMFDDHFDDIHLLPEVEAYHECLYSAEQLPQDRIIKMLTEDYNSDYFNPKYKDMLISIINQGKIKSLTKKQRNVLDRTLANIWMEEESGL